MYTAQLRVNLNFKSHCLKQCFQTSLPAELQLPSFLSFLFSSFLFSFLYLCHLKKVAKQKAPSPAEITEIGQSYLLDCSIYGNLFVYF